MTVVNNTVVICWLFVVAIWSCRCKAQEQLGSNAARNESTTKHPSTTTTCHNEEEQKDPIEDHVLVLLQKDDDHTGVVEDKIENDEDDGGDEYGWYYVPSVFGDEEVPQRQLDLHRYYYDQRNYFPQEMIREEQEKDHQVVEEEDYKEGDLVCVTEQENDEDEEAYDPLEDLGVTQRFVDDSDDERLGSFRFTLDDFDRTLVEMKEYRRSISQDANLYKVMGRCQNHHHGCTMEVMVGGCEHEDYRPSMLEYCPLACHACDMLLYENRCPYDKDALKAWEEPHALNHMFERIISDPTFQEWYKPKVWSRPFWAEPNPDYYDLPWIVSLDDFLSNQEIERLLEMASTHGYERSDEGGYYQEDGSFVTFQVDFRTSLNAWCEECYDDPIGMAVLERIQNVTQIDTTNYNNLQMLRYTTGQKYETHHDFDVYTVPRQPGPRILTVFMYLNDVEEGGYTDFPDIGLRFKPKKGRVVIWPNVLDENPFEWDPITHHQALPVTKGVKYAANAWIHMHDFQGPYDRNCAD